MKPLKVSSLNGRKDGIKFYVRYPSEGKIKKSYFKKRLDAQNFVDSKTNELEQVGEKLADISHENRLAVVKWEQAKKDTPELESITLDSVITSYIETIRRRSNPIPLKQAVNAEIERLEKLNRSKRHSDTVKSHLTRFMSFYDEWMIQDFTPNQLESYLTEENEWSATTRRNHYRSLSALFKLALTKKWISESPLQQIELEKANKKEPEIYTTEEVSLLLNHCPERSLAAMALALFCGIRDAEIKRLKWTNLNHAESKITITAEIAKASRRRVIDIPPNCMQWITPLIKNMGKIAPTDQQYRTDLTKAHNIAKVKKANNGFRHSFASYHISIHNSADKTALILGHNSATVLFNHYEAVVTKSEAKTYFGIIPAKESNIVEITA